VGFPQGKLATLPFGPFTKFVVDSANSSQELTGAVRSARNAYLSGINRLSIRPGAQVAMTLMDDQGTPAPCTSVRYSSAFGNGSIAIGYSSVTQKVYLYRLDAGVTGYYDTGGTFHTSTTAVPQCVVWSSMTVVPDVLCTEGLGTLYISHTVSSDANGLYWPTKQYTDFNTISNLPASGTDGSSAGTDTAYFNGVIAFEQALIGWGFGAGTTAATAFRPEMIRYSPPSFGNLQVSDSITLGDRVRSLAERVIGAGVAGNCCYFGGANMLTRLQGYGRDSWDKTPIDRSYGFSGPKSMVTAGDTLYYWSRRGPMRIAGFVGYYPVPPEPLWDAVALTATNVINSSKIVAAFDADRDQVLFMYDMGSGVRAFCAFDVQRNVWLGPDSDFGISVSCAGIIQPYTASTATPPTGPAGPPTSASTTSIGQSTAQANWAAGDSSAQTEVSLAPQSTGVFSVIAMLGAGVSSYTFTSLSVSTPYEWRVRHVLNGQYSSYLGPTTPTEFTTAASTTLLPPSGLSVTELTAHSVSLNWTNSGESGVSTEVWQSSDGGSTFGVIQTVAVGNSSTTVTGLNNTLTYEFEVRHTKPGSTSSSFAGPVTIDMATGL